MKKNIKNRPKKDDVNLYNSYHIPARETKFAAGYDFEAIEAVDMKLLNEHIKYNIGSKQC